MSVELEVPGLGIFEFPDGTTEEQLQDFASNQLPQFIAQEQNASREGGEPGLLTTFNIGLKSLEQAFEVGKLTGARGLGVEVSEEDQQQIFQNIAEAEREKRAMPLPDAVVEFFNPEITDADAFWTFAKNPLTITSHIIAMSLGISSAASAMGITAGAVGGGPAGMAAGVGLGSFAAEYGTKVLESLQEEGINPEDPTSLQGAFEDPELMDRTINRAIKKGVPIGVLDGLTAGLAGRFVNAAGFRSLKALGKEAGTQVAGGVAGETLGQAAADPEFDMRQIFAEAIGELGTAAVEVPAGYYLRGRPAGAPLAAATPGGEQGLVKAVEDPPEPEGVRRPEDLFEEAKELTEKVMEGPGTEREKKVALQKEMAKRKVPGTVADKLYDEAIAEKPAPKKKKPKKPKEDTMTDFVDFNYGKHKLTAELQYKVRGDDIVKGSDKLVKIRTPDGRVVKKGSPTHKKAVEALNEQLGEKVREVPAPPKPKTKAGKLAEPKPGVITSKVSRGSQGVLWAEFPNENIKDLFELPAKMRVAEKTGDQDTTVKVAEARKRIADILEIGQDEVAVVAERYRKNVLDTMKHRKIGLTHRAPLPRSTHMRGTDADFQDILPSMVQENFRELEEVFRLVGSDYKAVVFNEMRGELERLVGPNTRLYAFTRKDIVDFYNKKTGLNIPQGVDFRGFQEPINNIVGIALDPNYRYDDYLEVMGHEGLHVAQYWLYTPEEEKLLDNARDHLKTVAETLVTPDVIQAYESKLIDPGIEWQAIIAGKYHQERLESMQKPGMKRPVRDALRPDIWPIFQKISDFFVRLGNWLNGMGFQTIEDFFEKYSIGDMAKRVPRKTARYKYIFEGEEQTAANFTSVDAATLEMDLTNGKIDLKKWFKGDEARADKFRQWFEGSQVVNEDGTPKVVFHTTTSPTITAFNNTKDIGFHFGTSEQANYMADLWKRQLGEIEETTGRVLDRAPWTIPVFVNPKKLLRMNDLGAWLPDEVLDYLYVNDHVGEREYNTNLNRLAALGPNNLEGRALVRDLIRRKGYDGIVYKNLGEGVGVRNPRLAEDSYIVFEPENIKSIFAHNFNGRDQHINASIISKARKSIPKDPEVNRMRDLGVWRRWLTTARDIATRFPGFAPVFNLIRLRDKERMTYMNEAAEEGMTGRSRIRALMEADPETQKNVAGMLEFARRLGLKNVPQDDDDNYVMTGDRTRGLTGTILEPGETYTLTGEEAKVLDSVREGTNYLWDKIINAFKYRHRLSSDMTSKDLRESINILNSLANVTEDEDMIAKLNDQIAEYKDLAEKLKGLEDLQGSDYFPFIRPGNKGITVKRKDPDTGKVIKEPVWFEVVDTTGFNRPTATRRLTEARQRLRELYPEAEGYMISPPFELNYDGIRKKFGGDEIFTIDMMASILGRDTKQEYAEIRDKLLNEIIDRKGFAAHLQRAKRIPGYTHDIPRAFGMYIAAASSYAANSRFSKDLVDAQESIPFEDQPGLKRYAEEFINYNNSPQEELTFFRNLGFFNYLGFNPSSAILQWVTLPEFTAPYLGQFVGSGSAYGAITRAFANVTRSGFGKLKIGDPTVPLDPTKLKLPSHIDKEAIIKAWDANVLKPAMGLEHLGFDPVSVHVMPPKTERLWRKSISASGLFFNTAESIGRMSAFIAVLDLAAKDPNFMKKVDAVLAENELWQHQKRAGRDSVEDFAEFVIDETFGVYGKINRAKYMRSYGAAIFQFQSYPQQMIELMARQAALHGPDGKRALAISTAALVFAGGLQGLPAAEDLKELAEAAWKGATHTDIDLDTEFREMIVDATDSKFTAEMMSRGAFRSMGIDISRRAALGNLPAMDMLKVLFGARSDPSDALGVPGSMTWGAYQDWQERRLVYGSDRAALEAFLPQALKNIYQAYLWNNEGVRTKHGVELLQPSHINDYDPENFSTAEALLKGVGFTASDISRVRERVFAQSRLERSVQPHQSAFYKRLAHAIIDAGRTTDKAAARQDIQEIWQEIREFNDGAPPEERVIIDPNYLRRLIRRLRLGAAEVPPEFAKKARRRAREIAEVY